MAAPLAVAVSDRRPPEERSTAPSWQDLSDDPAWFCAGCQVRMGWSREPASCKLVLVDTDATRARYPFAFRLEVTYSVENAGLKVAFDITNTGDETLPASIGAHPAFNWPLLPGLEKEAYALTFSDEEPAPIRRLAGGLMRAKAEPSPVRGKTLALSERLFDDDAVIIDQLASRSVRYAADRGPSIEMSWEGLPRTRCLVETGWRGVSLHRALARFCQPVGVRRRILRQARIDADRAGGNAEPVLSDTRGLRLRTPCELLRSLASRSGEQISWSEHRRLNIQQPSCRAAVIDWLSVQ